MGYYIRVLGIEPEQPELEYLRDRLAESESNAILRLETNTDKNWEQLVLTHPNGPEIAVVEFNPVISGELGEEELREFIEDVDTYKPLSAALWLKEYLPRVKAIYAFQLLSGTDVNDGGMPCMHYKAQSGQKLEVYSKPILKDSVMKTAITFSGSLAMGQQADGVWRYLKGRGGLLSKWTWEMQSTAEHLWMAECLPVHVCSSRQKVTV